MIPIYRVGGCILIAVSVASGISYSATLSADWAELGTWLAVIGSLVLGLIGMGFYAKRNSEGLKDDYSLYLVILTATWFVFAIGAMIQRL